MIAQRATGVPVAYLTGVREFWSMPFSVTKDTLVPRPETELLVELALARVTDGPVLDLGTGSGIIAIAIASECNAITIDAVDQSDDALAVARQNGIDNGQPQINFFRSDWFSNINLTQYELIVSNPPYIAADDVHLTLSQRATKFLAPGGWLLFEHGATQGADVRGLLQQEGFTQIATYTDLNQLERVTLGRRC